MPVDSEINSEKHCQGQGPDAFCWLLPRRLAITVLSTVPCTHTKISFYRELILGFLSQHKGAGSGLGVNGEQ